MTRKYRQVAVTLDPYQDVILDVLAKVWHFNRSEVVRYLIEDTLDNHPEILTEYIRFLEDNKKIKV